MSRKIISQSEYIRPEGIKQIEYLEQLYRIYEYADGLYFPDMKFRCGSLSNYVKTGILSEAEVEDIWKKNASMK